LIVLFSGCVGGPVPDPPNIETAADEPTASNASVGNDQPPTATVNNADPINTPSNAEGDMNVPSNYAGASSYAGAAGSQESRGFEDIVAGSGGVETATNKSQESGVDGGAAAAPGADEGYYPPFDPLTIANLQVNGALIPLEMLDLASTSVLVIQGKPDALSPGQALWVFNLETNAPPSIATAAEDGSFEIEIPYSLGDVLRFQLRQGVIYHEPVDLELSQDSLTLVPIEQVECVSIPAQLALKQSAPLLIDNQCEEAITILDIAWRAEGVPIAVEDDAGAVIEPSSARELNLSVTSDEVQPWINEDILLITIGLGDEEIRFATSVTIQ